MLVTFFDPIFVLRWVEELDRGLERTLALALDTPGFLMTLSFCFHAELHFLALTSVTFVS